MIFKRAIQSALVFQSKEHKRMLELSYKQEQPSEIVAQHSRVTKRGSSGVPDDFDPGSGRAVVPEGIVVGNDAL